MLYAFALLLAQAEQQAPQQPQQSPLGSPWLLLPLVILMLYFFIVVIPGRRRAERERQESINKMEKGTEVLTIAGIYGTVISVHPEKDEIVVKVDDGTRLRMTKASIHRNLTAEEAAKKAKETPPATTTATTTPNQTK